MNLLFRLIRILILARLRPSLNPLALSSVAFRTWPTDLDINIHMTNSRYFALMDLGRTELMLRTGIVRQAFKHKWQPVITISTMRFKRSIKPFQRFTLETQALFWDEKGFYVEQRFVADGKTLALALVKAVFVGPHGVVRPDHVCALVGMKTGSPDMPDWLAGWTDIESAIEARLAAI
ncbi:thioesterase family protein [Thalassospira sp.]|uniref:thioesterase family protein n=1 Tax=Thalassospira sp. TaxID=1912094 RepID=UPI002732C924|nr:thioesterase family protein [Thalassospira sp.]MDP2699115.1 thioesterase family protein [Thalassospira sp.]